MEKAIQKAIEGGYEPFNSIRLVSVDKIEQTDFQTLTLYHQGTNASRASITIHRVLLDPEFWICLGNQLDKEFVESQMPDFVSFDKWDSKLYHHRFIDHIWEGKSADEFFKNLLK